MKKIKLTQGEFALVDDEDYETLSQYKWRIQRAPYTFYARRNIFVNNKRIHISMHRVIMQAPKGLEVDHIDRNGLNNQKSNLRLCTSSQNRYNQKLRTGCRSRYKGVFWNKDRNKWGVRIQRRGNRKYLGSSSSEEECARMYDTAAKELFGEFARLNFPE